MAERKQVPITPAGRPILQADVPCRGSLRMAQEIVGKEKKEHQKKVIAVGLTGKKE